MDYFMYLTEVLKSAIGLGNASRSVYWGLQFFKRNGAVHCIGASPNFIIEVDNVPVQIERDLQFYSYFDNMWHTDLFPVSVEYLQEIVRKQKYSHHVLFRRKEIALTLEQRMDDESKDKSRIIFSSPALDLSDNKAAVIFQKEHGVAVARYEGLPEIRLAHSSPITDEEIIPGAKYICHIIEESEAGVRVQALYPWAEAVASIINSKGKLYIPGKENYSGNFMFPSVRVQPLFQMDQRLETVIPDTHVDGSSFTYSTRALQLTNTGEMNISFGLQPLQPIMIWDRNPETGMEVRITLAPLMQNTGAQRR